jgi:hypothetical protein
MYDLAPCGVLVRDIKYIMFSEFAEIRVRHNPPSCNAVVDKLAKFGSRLASVAGLIWVGDTHVIVNDLVTTDLQSVSS